MRINWMVFFLLLIAQSLFAMSLDEAGFGLATRLMERGEYVSAVEEFEAIVKEYPNSHYYEQSVLDSAKCWYALKRYEKSALRYGQVLILSHREVALRQALFGLAMSRYQNREWKEAVLNFERFASLYPDSPVAPAALYYGFLSAKRLGDGVLRDEFKRNLVEHYPKHRYARKLDGREKKDTKKLFETVIPTEKTSGFRLQEKRAKSSLSMGNEAKHREKDKNSLVNPEIHQGFVKPKIHKYEQPQLQGLRDKQEMQKVRTNVVQIMLTNVLTNEVLGQTNVAILEKTNFVELLLSNEVVTYITNEYHITNQIMITNIWTDYKTNRIKIVTNEVVHTVEVIDTNWLQQKKLGKEAQAGREEIERLRGLVELKAKLLDLKQKMIERKENIVFTNGEDQQ